MTTYILKDTYEQLIERPLTQKIIYIMKNSKQEEFTKREIFESGIKRYQKNFKSDPKGHTILRYLKTMALYGLVEEIKIGNGKPSYWKLNEISPKLDFQVLVNDHINRLKDFSKAARRDDQDQLFDSIHESGVTVYNINVHKYIEKGSSYEKVLNIYIENFRNDIENLYSLQARILKEQDKKNSEKIINSSHYSLIDKYLSMIYIVSLTTVYMADNFNFGQVNDKGRPISFRWFETNNVGDNTFPFTVKPDIELLNIFCNILCTNDRKKVWNMLNGHVMDQNICHDLIDLHNTHNELFFPILRTTVVCEIDIQTYSKKMDKVMKKEELNFYENIRNFMKRYSI